VPLLLAASRLVTHCPIFPRWQCAHDTFANRRSA
jgi:hypothetical protein